MPPGAAGGWLRFPAMWPGGRRGRRQIRLRRRDLWAEVPIQVWLRLAAAFFRGDARRHGVGAVTRGDSVVQEPSYEKTASVPESAMGAEQAVGASWSAAAGTPRSLHAERFGFRSMEQRGWLGVEPAGRGCFPQSSTPPAPPCEGGERPAPPSAKAASVPPHCSTTAPP
jgi:hypothetical protein